MLSAKNIYIKKKVSSFFPHSIKDLSMKESMGSDSQQV